MYTGRTGEFLHCQREQNLQPGLVVGFARRLFQFRYDESMLTRTHVAQYIYSD